MRSDILDLLRDSRPVFIEIPVRSDFARAESDTVAAAPVQSSFRLAGAHLP